MKPHFDGATYTLADRPRLAAQYIRVWHLMRDGKWRTLDEISAATGAPEASVSARLRDMRKPRFGENTIERRHIARGSHHGGHGMTAETVLETIERLTTEMGHPPSVRELTRALQMRSTAHAHYWLSKLREEGSVTWADGRYRTLRVVR